MQACVIGVREFTVFEYVETADRKLYFFSLLIG